MTCVHLSEREQAVVVLMYNVEVKLFVLTKEMLSLLKHVNPM